MRVLASGFWSWRSLGFGVLAGAAFLWAMGGTQHERPVLTEGTSAKVRALEMQAEIRAADPEATRELAQAYLDARQPGLALALVESAKPVVKADAGVQHAYARSLLDAGQSDQALAVEDRVVEACRPVATAAGPVGGLFVQATGCDPLLFAGAVRRADILRELVFLGVKDAEAHPQASLVAYQNATREAHVVVE